MGAFLFTCLLPTCLPDARFYHSNPISYWSRALRNIVAFLLNALIVPLSFLAIGSLFKRHFVGKNVDVMPLHPGVVRDPAVRVALPIISWVLLASILTFVIVLVCLCKRRRQRIAAGNGGGAVADQDIWEGWRTLLGAFDGEGLRPYFSSVMVSLACR